MKNLLLGLLLSFTASSVYSQTILFEDFDQGTLGTFTTVDGGTTTDTWEGTTNGYNGNNLDGTEFAFVDSDAAGNAPNTILSEQLLTPVFNGLAYPQVILEFDHFYQVFSTDSGYVEVFDGNQWVELASYGSNTGAWSTPVRETFNLTPYRNANMQVRFRYEDYAIWAWFWAVDNVRLYAPLAVDVVVTGGVVPGSGCGLGQSESLQINLQNAGLNALSIVTVSYQINSGAIITENPNVNLPAGASTSYTFATGANLATPGVYDILFFSGQAGDGDLSNDTLGGFRVVNHAIAAPLPQREDFEAGAGGWFSYGENDSWDFGFPNKNIIQGASSGQNAWVTGGLGNTQYNDFEESYAESPCYDLSGLSTPWVGLDIWWNAETSYDGAALQVSADGGQTWTTVGALGDPYNWYTDGTINGNPGGQQDGWTGWVPDNNGSDGYVRAVHNVQSVAGSQDVVFRVAFGTDLSVTSDGIAFDNFTLGNAPTANLGPDTTVCDSIVLDAGIAVAYEWNTGDSTRFLTVDSSGTYLVAVVDTNGFPGGDLVMVEIFSTQGADLGQDTTLCLGEGLVLEGDPVATSYLWSTGDSSQSVSVGAAGIYWVELAYGNSCTVKDSIEINLSNLQAAFTLPDDTLCRGQIFQFTDASTGAGNWSWDFGNGNQSTNQNPFAFYSAGGTYNVSLEVTDGACTNTASQVVFVDICVGSPEAEVGSLSLYPVPAQEFIWVEMNGFSPGKSQLRIRDLMGRVLWEETRVLGNGDNNIRLDLSGLSTGIFIIEVEKGGIRWTKTFARQH